VDNDKESQSLAVSEIEKREELQTFTTNAAKADEYAKKLALKNEADHETAIKGLARIAGERKRGDEMRRFFTDPLNEQTKRINALFKPSLDLLAGAETEIRHKLIAYQAEVAKKADAAKAKVMEKVEAGTMKIETAVKKIESVKEPEKTVRTEEGTITYKEVKKVIIEDASKLPREYLVPDEVKIRKVALAGVEIPGVKVVVEKVPSLRAAA
jgi:hypothetical protein